MSATELTVFTGGENHSKKLRSVGHDLLSFVLINSNTGLTKQFLIKDKVDWNFANISESEGSLLAAADNNVTKVANISADLNIVQVNVDTVDLHLGGASSVSIVTTSFECLFLTIFRGLVFLTRGFGLVLSWLSFNDTSSRLI